MLKQAKLILFLLLFIFALPAVSQNIEIGSPFETKKGKLMVVSQSSVVDKEGNIYAVETSRSPLFSTALVIRKFDKNLKLIKENKIKNKQGTKTLLAHLELGKDNNLNIYTHSTSILRSESEVYLQKVDLKKLSVVKTIKLADIEYKEKLEYSLGEVSLNKFYTYNNEKAFYALPYMTKDATYVKFLEIDIQNPSRNKEKDVKISSNKVNRNRITNIFFHSKTQKLYTTIETYSDEEKDTNIYLVDYSIESNEVNTKKIDTKGKTIKFNEIITQDENILVYGVYSSKDKLGGICYLDWANPKDLVWLETTVKLEKNIGNLLGKKSYTMSDGSTIFICEENNIFTTSRYDPSSGKTRVNYYSTYGNLVIYKIKDNKLEWLTPIEKNQTILSFGFHICSIGTFVKDNNIYIYSNSEGKYDTELRISGPVVRNMNLIELEINPVGKISRKVVANKESINEKNFALLPQYTNRTGSSLIFFGWGSKKRNIVKIDF